MCFLAIHGQRSVLQCKSCKISAKITSFIRQENLYVFSENYPMNTFIIFFNLFIGEVSVMGRKAIEVEVSLQDHAKRGQGTVFSESQKLFSQFAKFLQ